MSESKLRDSLDMFKEKIINASVRKVKNITRKAVIGIIQLKRSKL